jgi:hypothetical protein
LNVSVVVIVLQDWKRIFTTQVIEPDRWYELCWDKTSTKLAIPNKSEDVSQRMKIQLLFYCANVFISGLGGERQTEVDLHMV